MLVTFSCEGWNNITMFGDVALTLLKMSGHSGTVPGAILADDVPAALANLKQQLDTVCPENNGAQDAEPNIDSDEEAPAVGLRLRAYPLLQMLAAACETQSNVMWQEGIPLV